MRLRPLIAIATISSLALLHQSCSNKHNNRKVCTQIKESEKSGYILDLQDLAIPSWDTLYIARYGTGDYLIEHFIKGQPFQSHGFSTFLIFTKSGQIVYQESWPRNIEKFEDGDIVFSNELSSALFMCSRNNSRFTCQSSNRFGPSITLVTPCDPKSVVNLVNDEGDIVNKGVSTSLS